MKLGVKIPQPEIGTDPAAIREYARAIEAMGYDFVIMPEHVVGRDPNVPGWNDDWWDVYDEMHAPLVLYSHLAAVTETLTLVTGIVILPQRQTALVASQAAEVDVLSEGRLRLGVGIGNVEEEYRALGAEFKTRGPRIEEQVEVLRRLWTEDIVTYEGRWHDVPGVGLNPKPIQRPIPVWMAGGHADVVLRRMARLADGWIMPYAPPMDELESMLERIFEHADEIDRDMDDFSTVGHLVCDETAPDEWAAEAADWRAMGTTHLPVVTEGMGLSFPDEHLATLERARDAIADAGLLDD